MLATIQIFVNSNFFRASFLEAYLTLHILRSDRRHWQIAVVTELSVSILWLIANSSHFSVTLLVCSFLLGYFLRFDS